MTEPPPRELVVLVEEEFVDARGSVKISWLVSHNDGWIPALKSAGATRKRLDTAPRIVWRAQVEIELPRGTRLKRVEARAALRRGTTLDHLTGSARSARPSVVETHYVVGPRGALAPEPRGSRSTK